MKRPGAVAVVFFALAVQAQEKVSETVEVRVVNVDVVVRDRAGNPVHGLTKDDFEVYQNGKKQVITNLYEAAPAPPAAVTAAATARPAATPVSMTTASFSDARPHRILVLVDNYSLDPARRAEVLKAVERFISQQKRPGDEIALVTWNRSVKIITPFTADAAKLDQGLVQMREVSKGSMSFQQEMERVRAECQRYYDMAEATESGGGVGMSFPEAFEMSRGAVKSYGEEAYLNSKNLLDALKTTTATFAGLDGKKALLLAGAHLPEAPGEELSMWLFRTYSRKIRNLSGLNIADSPRTAQRMNLEDVAAQASAADVALYFIDGGNPGDFSKSAEVHNADTSGLEDFLAANNTADAFIRLAQVTGGSVVTKTQSFDLAFDNVSRDLNSYYSIGFQPTEGDNGKSQRVTVKVRNAEYNVRSRMIYTPRSLDSEVTQRLMANLVHGDVHGDWSINVTTGPPERDGKYFKVPMEISLAPTLTLLPAGSDISGGYTVYIIMGNNGAVSKVMKTVQDVRMPAAAEADARKQPFTFTGTLMVRPGENVLSVAVVDRVSNAVGYARTAVKVE